MAGEREGTGNRGSPPHPPLLSVARMRIPLGPPQRILPMTKKKQSSLATAQPNEREVPVWRQSAAECDSCESHPSGGPSRRNRIVESGGSGAQGGER